MYINRKIHTFTYKLIAVRLVKMYSGLTNVHYLDCINAL